jgi:hypothetical protein
MLGRDDAHAYSATQVYMVLLDVQLAAGKGGGAARDAVKDDGGGTVAAGEGGGAAQDAVKDDGGGTVMGGGEDCGKGCNDADGNGHGHGHGHGQRQCGDATSTG